MNNGDQSVHRGEGTENLHLQGVRNEDFLHRHFSWSSKDSNDRLILLVVLLKKRPSTKANRPKIIMNQMNTGKHGGYQVNLSAIHATKINPVGNEPSMQISRLWLYNLKHSDWLISRMPLPRPVMHDQHRTARWQHNAPAGRHVDADILPTHIDLGYSNATRS